MLKKLQELAGESVMINVKPDNSGFITSPYGEIQLPVGGRNTLFAITVLITGMEDITQDVTSSRDWKDFILHSEGDFKYVAKFIPTADNSRFVKQLVKQASELAQ